MDDIECDFDELDKLIAQEVTKDPLSSYDIEDKIDSCNILEEAYSKIAFYSETIWWDQNTIDEYRINNLGLWSAVMGCDQCRWNHNIPVKEKLKDTDENKKESKEQTEGEDNETSEWLKKTPWPTFLLKIYPQIPDAVASNDASYFSHIHSSFAGDSLHNKINNVKELIQYNRLKQDCVKNLWNTKALIEDFKQVKAATEPALIENKSVDVNIKSLNKYVASENRTTYNEICVSLNDLKDKKSFQIKTEAKDDKFEITLFESKKMINEFVEHVFSAGPSYSISIRNNYHSQEKKISFQRKSINSTKISTTDCLKKHRKLSDRSIKLIKEHFGTFPFDKEEIIGTLEEVCQWLHNVYPQSSSKDYKPMISDKPTLPESENNSTKQLLPVKQKSKDENQFQITKILSRPATNADLPTQVFNQNPSKRLYRDVLTNSETHSIDGDPSNKYEELEREALEQYSGCSINSENSVAILTMDEDSRFKDLEREAIEQYQPADDSIITSEELFAPSELIVQTLKNSSMINTEELKQDDCLNCLSRKQLSGFLFSSSSKQDNGDFNNLNNSKGFQTGFAVQSKWKNINYEQREVSINQINLSMYDGLTGDIGSKGNMKVLAQTPCSDCRHKLNNEKEEDQQQCEESRRTINKDLVHPVKQRETDEEKQGYGEIKKKKRYRKKRCKKDGGGGGRCDARTPIHCLPASGKTLEIRVKRKEEYVKKEKKESKISNLPLKWQHLQNIITSNQENVESLNKLDDLYYDEYSLEQISRDKTINTSISHNFFKMITSFDMIVGHQHKTSVLIDNVFYRLQKWGWCYLSYKELFSKCLGSCCFNAPELYPSWLKWCRCFTPRIGPCHFIRPCSILVPDIWRIPKADVFNPKFWCLTGGDIAIHGMIIAAKKIISLEATINSLINTVYKNNKNLISNKEHNLFSINYYKYVLEMNYQKIFHTCFTNNQDSIKPIHFNKKTNRKKLYKGKTNKIKGKTFCYYCSGNIFKNYTFHSFFCEVNTQYEDSTIDNGQIQTSRNALCRNTKTISKYQQTEEQGNINYNEGSVASKTSLDKGCQKSQNTENEEACDSKYINQDSECNNIDAIQEIERSTNEDSTYANNDPSEFAQTSRCLNNEKHRFQSLSRKASSSEISTNTSNLSLDGYFKFKYTKETEEAQSNENEHSTEVSESSICLIDQSNQSRASGKFSKNASNLKEE